MKRQVTIQNPLLNTIVINSINNLRTNPSSYIHKFNTISKALLRTKKKEQAGELIEIITKIENDQLKLEPFQSSQALSEIADLIIKEMIRSAGESNDESKLVIEKKSFDDLISKVFSKVEGLSYIVDIGDIDNIETRILITDKDQSRLNKKSIFSKEINFIGGASKQYFDDDINVIIFAKDLLLRKEEDSNEDSDLYQMFCCLDDQNTGYIDPFLIYDMLIENEFDQKNPAMIELFKRCKERVLSQNEKYKTINYTTFKEVAYTMHVNKPYKTIDDYRRIFSLFVDDVESNTISISNVKRIIRMLDEDIPSNEIKKYMNWLTKTGNELSFEEFYDIMTVKILDDKEKSSNDI